MLSLTNTNGNGASNGAGPSPPAIGVGGLTVAGSTGYAMSVFCPTAMAFTTGGSDNTVTQAASRTATTCYLRGYKENLRIQSNTPLPWLWRRICFTYRGPDFNAIHGDGSPTTTYVPFVDSSGGNGMQRQWFNLQVNNTPSTVAAFNSIIFRGDASHDWDDVITAKVDTSRITVKSDRTRRILTGNSNGHFSERKLWYPMNHNLVYDDDELGKLESSSYYSVESSAGMGNYYIVDYVAPGLGGGSGDIVNLRCTATLYWHER